MNMVVKGMIFAAGLGTRLKPFTLNHPKAMVSVGGIPMLKRVIDKLIRAGITEIVINAHHFAEEIINYAASLEIADCRIYISHEKEQLLDTGGGILAARQWLEDADAVLIHNADILTDVNLGRLLENHSKSKAEVSLLVANRETSRYLYFDSLNKRLRGWSDIRNGAVRPAKFIPDAGKMVQRAYAGVHVFNPSIYNKLERYREKVGEVFSIIPFYVDSCNTLDIRGYEQDDSYHWLDVGKPDSLKLAEDLIKIFK